jgi:hypothetical protein
VAAASLTGKPSDFCSRHPGNPNCVTSSSSTSITTPTTTTNPAGGNVLYGINWDQGQAIPSDWSNGCGTTITIDTSRFVSPPGSGHFSTPPNVTRCELYHVRPNIGNHLHDYYAQDIWFPTNWQYPMGLDQFNIDSMDHGPAGNLIGESNFLEYLVNSGACPAETEPGGCPYYSGRPYPGWEPRPAGMPGPLIAIPAPMQLGVWHELVIHIYWSTDNDGVVQIWHRLRGEAAWTETVDTTTSGFGFPTLQTGVQSSECGSGVITASNIAGWTTCVADTIGLYGGGWGGLDQQRDVWRDNYCRATSFTAAESCLG